MVPDKIASDSWRYKVVVEREDDAVEQDLSPDATLLKAKYAATSLYDARWRGRNAIAKVVLVTRHSKRVVSTRQMGPQNPGKTHWEDAKR